MCEKCFDREYFEFKDEFTFQTFYKDLKFKVKNGNISELGYWEGKSGKPKFRILGFWIGEKEKWIPGYYKYRCNSCGQNWKFSFPENADRGYFKKNDKID